MNDVYCFTVELKPLMHGFMLVYYHDGAAFIKNQTRFNQGNFECIQFVKHLHDL